MMKNVLIVCWLAAAGCCGAHDIYLRNGDFEQGLEHWGAWGGSAGTVRPEKGDAAAGESFLSITGTAEGKMTGAEQKHLPLKPGKTYRISLFLKADEKVSGQARALVGILERGERGKVRAQNYRPLRLVGDGKWNRYTADITTSGEPCEYYQFVFRLDKLGEGETVQLDGVAVSEPDPNALLERSSGKAEESALLEQLKNQAAGYRRRSDRTAIFSRVQLKYGLQRNDYLHKWIDRPLLVNPSLPADGNFINDAAYDIMRRVVEQYRLDGFAFFPETSGRAELYRHARKPGREMKVLTELIYDGSRDFEKKIELARIALEHPQSMRLDGKVVFTSYPASDDSEYWRDLKKALAGQFGDRFILMPYYNFFPKNFRKTGADDTFSAADLDFLRRRLREWLRTVDGYYHNTPGLKNRRYYAPVDREIIIPLVHGVLMEPEFRDKYLAWGVKVGHENYELLGYSMDHAGTGMLRGTMETAILARPDIINCVEWDEQNENTSFRPTLYNSWSTMRIMRYYGGVLNGGFEDLPGDRMDIPNIILSYRKILAAGQVLELELLNVPDRGAGEGAYQAELVLRDIAGQEVRRFPPQELRRNALDAVTLEAPVEEIVGHQVVIPELTVRSGAEKHVFADGFQPVELRASRNWDYKWAKQPLRDLLVPVKADLRIAGVTADNRLRVKGTIEAPEPLNSIEIMDSGDVAYSHQRAGVFREDDDHYAININLQAKRQVGDDPPLVLNGRIGFPGSTLLRHREIPPHHVKYAGDGWVFDRVEVNHHALQLYAVISRRDAAGGVIAVDLPGYCRTEIKLAELMEKEVIGFPGPAGFNLVAKRFNSETALPEPWGEKSAEFEVVITPSEPNSVLHLQAVGAGGRTYRGKPVSLYRPSGAKGRLAVYSLKNEQPVTIELDRALMTEFDYRFDPGHGSVLVSPGGPAFYGIGGGYVPQVSGRGSGESLYGNAGPVGPGQHDRCPRWTQEPDGSWSLDFRESHVSLPMALVPPFGSFEITMEVWPRSISGTQTLLGCDFTGFMLLLKNGVPTAGIYLNNNYETSRPALAAAAGPALRPGAWNRIKVRFDQSELAVEVDGQSGPAVKASGYQRYPRIFGLGADQRRGNYFDGRIRSLRVRHGVI